MTIAASTMSCGKFVDQEVAREETTQVLQEKLIIDKGLMDAVAQHMQKLKTSSLYTKWWKREDWANLSYDADDQTYKLSQQWSHYIIVKLDDGAWMIDEEYHTIVDWDNNIIEDNKKFVPSVTDVQYIDATIYSLLNDWSTSGWTKTISIMSSS